MRFRETVYDQNDRPFDNDFPANALAAVKIASLPVKGSLKLNNVAVTLNQTIPVANLNSNIQLASGKECSTKPGVSGARHWFQKEIAPKRMDPPQASRAKTSNRWHER